MSVCMDFKKIIKELEVRQAAVGAERDKLQDYIDELEGLKETCDRAYDSIYEAISALSELA